MSTGVPMIPPLEKLSVKDRMFRMYVVYNPEKVSQIDELLVKFKGREKDVLQTMINKYGSEPTEQVVQKAIQQRRRASQGGPNHERRMSVTPAQANGSVAGSTAPSTPQQLSHEPAHARRPSQGQPPTPSSRGPMPHKERIFRMYLIYNREKIKDIDALIAKFPGREDAIIEELIKKYGPEPTNTQVGQAMQAARAADHQRRASQVSGPDHQRQASQVGEFQRQSSSRVSEEQNRKVSPEKKVKDPVPTQAAPSHNSKVSSARSNFLKGLEVVDSDDSDDVSEDSRVPNASPTKRAETVNHVSSPLLLDKVFADRRKVLWDHEFRGRQENLRGEGSARQTLKDQALHEVRKVQKDERLSLCSDESGIREGIERRSGLSHFITEEKQGREEAIAIKQKPPKSNRVQQSPPRVSHKLAQGPGKPTAAQIQRKEQPQSEMRKPVTQRKVPAKSPRRETSPSPQRVQGPPSQRLMTPARHRSPSRKIVVDRRDFSPNLKHPPIPSEVMGTPRGREHFPSFGTPSRERTTVKRDPPPPNNRAWSTYSTFNPRGGNGPSSWATSKSEAHPMFNVPVLDDVEVVKDVPTGKAAKEQLALNNRLSKPKRNSVTLH